MTILTCQIRANDFFALCCSQSNCWLNMNNLKCDKRNLDYNVIGRYETVSRSKYSGKEQGKTSTIITYGTVPYRYLK